MTTQFKRIVTAIIATALLATAFAVAPVSASHGPILGQLGDGCSLNPVGEYVPEFDEETSEAIFRYVEVHGGMPQILVASTGEGTPAVSYVLPANQSTRMWVWEGELLEGTCGLDEFDYVEAAVSQAHEDADHSGLVLVTSPECVLIDVNLAEGATLSSERAADIDALLADGYLHQNVSFCEGLTSANVIANPTDAS